MRASNQWNYIKYDVKGRAISQGIYTDATHTSLSAMQSYVSGLNYSSNWYEARSSAGTTTGYYTNNAFPNTNITPTLARVCSAGLWPPRLAHAARLCLIVKL